MDNPQLIIGAQVGCGVEISFSDDDFELYFPVPDLLMPRLVACGLWLEGPALRVPGRSVEFFDNRRCGKCTSMLYESKKAQRPPQGPKKG